MIYRLKVSNRFKRELKKLDKSDILKIKNALDNLLEDPFADNNDVTPIVDHKEPPMYRLRVGNYRIIYVVTYNDIKAGLIFDRKKGYKRYLPFEQYFR